VGRPRITLDLFGHRLDICPQDASIRKEKKAVKTKVNIFDINPKIEAVYALISWVYLIFIAQY
jgi:hypothetical protein